MGLTDLLAVDCHLVNQLLASAFRQERPDDFLLVFIEEVMLPDAYPVLLAIRRGVFNV